MQAGWIAFLGLLIGCAAGYATRRARLCTFGAFEDAVSAGDLRRLKIFGLALAVALVGAQALVAANLLQPELTPYGQQRLPWFSIALGGFMFGLGMALVGTCAFGSLVRLGGGDLRALVTTLVLGLFALATLRGILEPVRTGWLESVFVERAQLPLAGIPANNLAIAVAIAAALLWAVRREKRLRHARRMITAGAVLGLSIVAGWITTSVLADPFETNGLAQSLTFVAPAARAVFGIFFASTGPLDFGVMSVIGVTLGAFLAAWRNDEVHWEAFDNFARDAPPSSRRGADGNGRRSRGWMHDRAGAERGITAVAKLAHCARWHGAGRAARDSAAGRGADPRGDDKPPAAPARFPRLSSLISGRLHEAVCVARALDQTNAAVRQMVSDDLRLLVGETIEQALARRNRAIGFLIEAASPVGISE